MLATLADEPFSSPEWVFERKLDGERVLAFRHGREVRLLSRNKKIVNTAYPQIAAAVAAQPATDFVVDGEVVAFDGALSSFAKLQPRMRELAPACAQEAPARRPALPRSASLLGLPDNARRSGSLARP